jgi:hypothetical protein
VTGQELDPTGDTITEKDVIEKTVPTEGKVDVLTIETKLMREVEVRGGLFGAFEPPLS